MPVYNVSMPLLNVFPIARRSASWTWPTPHPRTDQATASPTGGLSSVTAPPSEAGPPAEAPASRPAVRL